MKSFFRFTAAFIVICFATQLWADCAPDYRSDKKSGVFVQDFVIEGTSTLSSDALQTIRGKLIGSCVDESTDDLEQLVRELFQNEGYYAAAVKHLDIKVVDPLAKPKTISLDADVSEGPVYKLGDVSFVGNHALSATELRDAFSIRKGEMFNRNTLASGLDAIRKQYGRSGFGDVVFIPDDTADVGNFMVNLRVTIEEGPQYHMDKLVVVSKSDDLGERLQGSWGIPAGTVFDFDYPDEYIKSNRDLLPSTFSRNDMHVVRDCPDATVTVWLVLEQSAVPLQSQPKPVRCKDSHANPVAVNGIAPSGPVITAPSSPLR